MSSLATRLGLEGNGYVILTCEKCGAHTAGKPPVVCWACESDRRRAAERFPKP